MVQSAQDDQVNGVNDAVVRWLRVRHQSAIHATASSVSLACIANGLSMRIFDSIREYGLVDAIGATFGISVIVWFSIYNFLNLVRFGDLGRATKFDFALLSLAIIGFCIPLPSASWAGLSVLSVYYLLKRDVNGHAKRAFAVTLAMCFSLQWSQWISAIFLPYVLDVDAMLVSLVSGYPRYGNLVQVPKGTTLEIMAACSSFVNVSLAFLAWINARAHYGTRGFSRSIRFLSAMIFLVVLVNTIRITLIAFFPERYDLIHGTIGTFVGNMITTSIIVFLSAIGARI